MVHSALVRPGRLAAFAVAGVLVIGLAGIGGASAESASQTPVAAPGSPGRVTALDIAKERGARVEDLSQRTETEQVFANPDGTWTAEISAEPVRVQGSSGTWYDIDPTLVRRGSTVVPRHGSADVVFSGGGDRRFATIGSDRSAVAFAWGSTLPRPVLRGATATYRNAVPGADLVLTATGTGFSHSLVIRERPASRAAAQAILDAGARIGVRSSGVDLRRTRSGALEARSADGTVLTSAPAPLVWDARRDRFGDPADVRVAAARVRDLGDVRSNAHQQELAIVPDAGYLLDPGTRFPVTIDPSFTQADNGDTWIQNAGFTISQAASDELRVGTYDGGAHIARSFLKFPQGAFSGKEVTAATLWMRNWYANSCTAANINAVPIIEPWSVQDLTWGNQPNFTYTNGAIFSTAYGASGCPANGANWNLTNLVKGWADGSIDNYGIRLHATSENFNGSWRRYRSINYGDVAVAPRLVVTYTVPLIDDPGPDGDPNDVIDPVVSTSYPGIDSAQLSDLTGIAAIEGITVQQAVDRYGWQDQFTDAVGSVAEAYPDSFADASISTTPTPGATVRFTTAPAGVAAEFADVPVPVTVVGGAPYSDVTMDEMAQDARDAISAQVGPEASVIVIPDQVAGTLSAKVNVPDGTTNTASGLRTAAQGEIATQNPTVTVPNVDVTFSADPVYQPDTLYGGVRIGNDSGACTLGFAVMDMATMNPGFLTARHCLDSLDTYAAGTAHWRIRLAPTSRWLPTPYGDIEFHAAYGEPVGAGFYAAASPTAKGGKLRSQNGKVAYAVRDTYYCLFGRRTLGYRQDKARPTCARIQRKGVSFDYKAPSDGHTQAVKGGGLVMMRWAPGMQGDSGGPWYFGRTGIGIHSGTTDCVASGRCSLMSPLAAALRPDRFDVRMLMPAS